MTTTIELLNEMKEESIKRLRTLNIYKPYINGFKSNKQKVCFYENFGGFWVEEEPEIMQKLKEVELGFDCIVYAITHEFTEFGECWDFIMTSKYKEDWRFEIEKTSNPIVHNVFAYVWNKTAPDCSEPGTIQVQSFGGGIRRVA